jgi:hypothetical protein
MLLKLHLIYVILEIKMPSSIWSSHLFLGGQPALLYIVSGLIGFVTFHCLWNREVKQVRLINLCHIIVCTIDILVRIIGACIMCGSPHR